MGVPDYLTCLLRNLCAGQEATVRTLYGTTDCLKIEKGVWQSCLLSPCLFNLYTENIMRNAGLDELQAGIRIGGRNINNLRYADNTTLLPESEEELKSLLMRVKKEWKSWLKTQHSKNDLFPSLQGKQMGKKCKQWQTLFGGTTKSLWIVTAVMKLKEASPWKKSYDKPRQHIKKQRHHFANKSPYSQSYGFSSSHVVWELDHKEGWVPKNWCFQIVVLEKIL